MLQTETQFTGQAGTPWVSLLHFSPAVEDVASATAAKAAAASFWGSFSPVIDSQVGWQTSPVVTRITPAGVTVGRLGAGTAVLGSGGLSGLMLPAANQALISWFTGVFAGGREVRGRTNIPGIGQTLGSAENGPAAVVVTAASTAISGLLAATPEFVIWSRANSAVYPATAGVLGQRFAVLRSRRD